MLILLFMLVANNRINTSLYTYHQIGGISVTDLYFNYVLHRYDLRVGMAKRQDETGLKSIYLGIDSALGDFRLALGESPYHVRAPVTTNLNLWGVSLTGRSADIFLGRVRDNNTSLPPTFSQNNYTVGVRLHRQALPRLPLDFYLIRRSDNTSPVRLSSNNSVGVNSEVRLGSRLTFENRLWASHTEQGIGASYAFNGRYTTDRYGGHCHITRMSGDYVPLSNVKMFRGTWLRLNTYERPSDLISFSQDLGYNTFGDMRVSFHSRLSPGRLPTFAYGISFSRAGAIQVFDSEYFHKGFGISANYERSTERHAYGFRIMQYIVNCQLWSSFQRRDTDVWQFGLMFPFPRHVRFKGFFNFVTRGHNRNHTTGLEISSRFFRDLNLSLTYEYIRHNTASDQFLTFSISKTLDLDRIGLTFISGRVFMDVNNNGMYDYGDQPMPDIDVIIDGKNETRTDKNGIYSFHFVRSGEHTVNVNLGCIPAEFGTAHMRQVVDTRLFSQARIDFPLEVMGSMSGKVYFDSNNNGEMDEGEDGIPNAVLALNGYLTTTDRRGEFRFANLSSGTYVLEPKVLPPETMATRQELLYVLIKPGMDIEDYTLGIVKKERPVNKKVFD